MFRLKCDQVLDVIVDYARGVPLPEATVGLVESHIGGCAACAARLRGERELTSGLKALAGLTSPAQPPAEMEQRLLNAFTGMHARTSRARVYSRVWRAAAAALLVASGLGTWMASKVPPDLSNGAARQGDASAARGAFDDFMPLPVASGLPALESGVIVRIELPVAALPRYGVAIPDTSRRELQADLLVGQDGQPRAIRFLNFERSVVASRSKP